MSLNNLILIPDLNYYFTSFVRKSILNKYQVPYASQLLDILFIDNRSFVRLLFDSEWPKTYSSYRYLYRLTNRNEWPDIVRSRLSLFSRPTYYLCDSDSNSINIFLLQNDDLTLLDKLLEYRTLDSTSVVITDIDYSSLSTPLSKMIFLYLDLQQNNNYINYDNEDLVSSVSSTLECCYEVFLVETMFNYIAINTIY